MTDFCEIVSCVYSPFYFIQFDFMIVSLSEFIVFVQKNRLVISRTDFASVLLFRFSNPASAGFSRLKRKGANLILF